MNKHHFWCSACALIIIIIILSFSMLNNTSFSLLLCVHIFLYTYFCNKCYTANIFTPASCYCTVLLLAVRWWLGQKQSLKNLLRMCVCWWWKYNAHCKVVKHQEKEDREGRKVQRIMFYYFFAATQFHKFYPYQWKRAIMWKALAFNYSMEVFFLCWVKQWDTAATKTSPLNAHCHSIN